MDRGRVDRFHALVDKEFSTGLDPSEEAEMIDLVKGIDADNEPFYRPIIERLRSLLDPPARYAYVPMPIGWTLDVGRGLMATTEPGEWQAWAHSPDGESGVLAAGRDEEEAVLRLKTRMEDWARTIMEGQDA